MPRPKFKMPDSVLLSFARGFWITFWNMMPWKRTTIQYPEAVRPQPAIFRSLLDLLCL